MSSLTNVISQISNLVYPSDEINRPLEWSKGELSEHLQKCPTSRSTLDWHGSVTAQLSGGSYSPVLGRLRNDVFTSLIQATKHLEKLRLYNAGDTFIHEEFRTDRHIVISSLQYITAAFKLFSVVRTDKSLETPQNREVVLKYLKKTYAFMIAISWLLYPSGSTNSWLTEEANYLLETKLRDFHFDRWSDYPKALDPTLSGVIDGFRAVPETCLPKYPQAPVLCRNPERYGSTILRNLWTPNNFPQTQAGSGPDSSFGPDEVPDMPSWCTIPGPDSSFGLDEVPDMPSWSTIPGPDSSFGLYEVPDMSSWSTTQLGWTPPYE
ncbi:uncharacterized protein LY89DRAFT_677891 [Mollisia scopiformis]|uniref:Uncharacterized protein n=1 Tax=Mollisia scopiformis TaxID=149040 RepID=A0A132B6G5_MOLSC|nr:uncharacterized protein LY89DRAFT_677891 [Mollisia scopiformis]KUJ07267.1 hypothetical protein LY89DRAFT_677891 [Mollisia scopiformis]